MLYKKTKMIADWFGNLLNEYSEYTKQSATNRCKIIGLETDKKTGKDKFLVKLNSVKNQIPVAYFPEELVANDSMLREFSQTDVRAITFYAINNSPRADNSNLKNNYEIVGQEFLDNKTLFIFKEANTEGEERMLASELYTKVSMLKQFRFEDLANIISTAVQEQTIKDVG